jgi:pimeloyl-ACP methyl ester carboxylesterase
MRPRTGVLTRASMTAIIALLIGVFSAPQTARAANDTDPIPRRSDVERFEVGRKKVLLPDGEALSYVTVGNATGQPVVFLHGFTDNAEDWVPLFPWLSDKFYLILVDLRGHGSSSAPECCYSRYDFAYDVKLLVDELHLQRVDVIGHSLGSMVAQTFAERWPERTNRVVLIGSSGGARSGITPMPVKFDYGAEIAKLKEPIDADSPFMVDWFSSPRPTVDPEFVRRMRQRGAAIPLRVWKDVLDQGLSDDLQRTLPKLKAPALLIWGADDPIMQEDVRQSLREALPHARVKVFAGLGHNPFWEEPKQCADVINLFLLSAGPGN